MIRVICLEIAEKHGCPYVRMGFHTDNRFESHLFMADGIERHFPYIVDPLSVTVEEARASLPQGATNYRDYDQLIEAVKDAPLGAVYALHGLLITECTKAYNTAAYKAVSRCELRLIEEVIKPRDLYRELK